MVSAALQHSSVLKSTVSEGRFMVCDLRGPAEKDRKGTAVVRGPVLVLFIKH